MAKPMPMLPPVREKIAVFDADELRPSRFTSAPPELPRVDRGVRSE